MSVDEKLIEEARSSLERIQKFDPKKLVQRDKLGEMNFEDAVEPTERLVALHEQLPISMMEELPANELTVIKQQSDAIYMLLDEVMKFDMEPAGARARHTALVQKIATAYQALFTAIYPLISYSMAKTVDFNQLGDQGRAAIQGVRDQSEILMTDIEKQKEDATSILTEVRKAAAEQGVSQQARYFKKEADGHGTEAEKWKVYTIWMAVAVGAFGLSTLFLHKIVFLAPANVYETVQLTVAKLIVFFVLTYMLALCAKNFSSNRHNEIVNRHRQNALMTYKALVEAGGTAEARDIVLNHAAASIYQLNETGYTKSGESSGSSSRSVVEMLPRATMPISSGSSS